MAGGKSGGANPKQTEKAGRFAPVDFMKFMQKNAVVAPREQRLKNEVRKIAAKCQIAAVSCGSTVAPHAGAWIEIQATLTHQPSGLKVWPFNFIGFFIQRFFFP